MSTRIEWTDETWNPVTGCTKVSAGCQNCYAERMAETRLRGVGGYPEDEPFRVLFRPDRLDRPVRWTRPRRIFVCSMGDLFHEDVTAEQLLAVTEVMEASLHHTFQVLTKRPVRMRDWFLNCVRPNGMPAMPNVWLGVTAENQATADERIPILLQTPAAVRFASVEPMLGPVLLEDIRPNKGTSGECSIDALSVQSHLFVNDAWSRNKLDWVIIGCESGPGRRPMKLYWAIDLVGQCQSAGVSVFVKQVEINGKVSKDPSEWPEGLRVREYPQRDAAAAV